MSCFLPVESIEPVASLEGFVNDMGAYPGGKDITLEQRIKLAAYSQTDPVAGFKTISDTEHPGILAAGWITP